MKELQIDNTIKLKVWGKRAMFTRPEFSAERVSYDVITPTAAEAILRAISWKPEFEWKATKIEILNQIERGSHQTNEIDRYQTFITTRSWQKNNGKGNFFIDECRTQRHNLSLVNVSYIIHAKITKIQGKNTPDKYLEIFNRRAKKGQYFRTPYLGIRECECHFSLPDGTEKPINLTTELGIMIFNFKEIKNKTIPQFFRAKITKGIMEIPEHPLK